MRQSPLLIFSLALLLIPLAHAADLPSSKISPPLSFFESLRIVEVRLDVATNDWNKLRHQHRDLLGSLGKQRFETPPEKSYSNFKAQLNIDGISLGEVGVRKKGFFGSADLRRPSLNILFDHVTKGREVDGLRRIALNNNRQDPSQIHQALVYSVYRKAGVPAPRCNFAHVVVNGNDLGIYTLVEPIDFKFIQHYFAKSNGTLYEGTLADFRPSWIKGFEKKSTNRNDLAELDPIVKALEAPNEKLVAELGRYIDIDKFFTYWAIEGLVGHWDGYCNNQNNFFIYRNPASDKFEFIPWGADSALGDPDPFHKYKPPESVRAVSILPRRLYRFTETRELYRQRLRNILENAWDEKELLAQLDAMHTLLKDRVHVPPQEFRSGIKRVREFIRSRRSAILPELDGPAPDWPHPLKKVPYLESSGTFSASFSTGWQMSQSPNPYTNGVCRISFKHDGTTENFMLTGAAAGSQNQIKMAGGCALTLFGLQFPGTKFVACITMIDDELFKQGGTLDYDAFGVMGVLLHSSMGGSDPKFSGLLSGKLTLDEASTREGAPVKGSIDAQVLWFPE